MVPVRSHVMAEVANGGHVTVWRWTVTIFSAKGSSAKTFYSTAGVVVGFGFGVRFKAPSPPGSRHSVHDA